MSVVRRGGAAVILMAVVTVWGAGTGNAYAQDATPAPDDGAPVSGCPQDPTICESGVTSLPRTGPNDRLLATGAVGAGLLLAGAGAVAAGRRRPA